MTENMYRIAAIVMQQGDVQLDTRNALKGRDWRLDQDRDFNEWPGIPLSDDRNSPEKRPVIMGDGGCSKTDRSAIQCSLWEVSA